MSNLFLRTYLLLYVEIGTYTYFYRFIVNCFKFNNPRIVTYIYVIYLQSHISILSEMITI